MKYDELKNLTEPINKDLFYVLYEAYKKLFLATKSKKEEFKYYFA